MELIRGQWFKKYINCPEDKRDYDIYKKGILSAGRGKVHFDLAQKYVEKYKIPDLTEVEKKEIREYWNEYGFLFDDLSWHRMYYFVTGIHKPQFIPDPIAGLVVYPFYNDHAYEYTWRDKNMFSRLLPEIPLPYTYCKCIRGRILNCQNGKYYSCAENFTCFFEELSLDLPETIVIKPSRESGFGRGVKKYDLKTKDDFILILKDWLPCENFIIQKCVQQHNSLSFFNDSSSNMIRICSWRHGNTVDILFAAARIGVKGAFTDISFVNGEEVVNIVGITEDGFFLKNMQNQDGIVIKEFKKNIKVPAWEKILNIVKINHLKVDNFDIIGWDFTIDKDENPLCFEWNIQWPGTVLYQYANGPLWGNKTEEVISFLKDKKMQDNYIPFYMRDILT